MSNVPLRRKIWFGWALFRLGFGILLVVALLACLVIGVIQQLHPGGYLNVVIIVVNVVAVAGLLSMRLVILRYHIRLGMHKELRKRNCCPNCTYDLRSSPLRCPECGHRLHIPNIEV